MEIKFEKINYYLKKENKILDNINIKIEKNSVVGIIGKNGSGKTTLLEILSGIIKPNSGKIVIGDIVINKKEQYDKNKLYNKIFFRTINNNNFSKKTVREELKHILNTRNLTLKKEDLLNYLNLLGLSEEFLKNDIKVLSDGNKSLLNILITLIVPNDILLYDEPTIYLDYKNKKRFIRLMKNLANNYNKTIIVASRDTELIHKLCNQVIVLDKGKVIKTGTKYEVFTDTKTLTEYEIPMPNVIKFSNIVLKEKNIKMGYRDEINDLLKDIYRYVK